MDRIDDLMDMDAMKDGSQRVVLCTYCQESQILYPDPRFASHADDLVQCLACSQVFFTMRCEYCDEVVLSEGQFDLPEGTFLCEACEENLIINAE